MAATASENLRLRNTDIGWPLEELWVTGELLSRASEVDTGAVVLVVDVPATEMPWLALHPTGEWIGEQLLEGYWEHDWRQAHKGYDETPEDHLWRAATAFVDVDDAVRRLG